MITILCPTRGRPDQLLRMIASVKCLADIYVGYANTTDFYSQCTDVIVPMELPDNLPTSHKWNVLAQEAMKNPDNKLFMLGADDMYFATEGWDKALIDHYNNLENKIHVYALQDSRDPEGVPHPIVSREWIEAMGYFLPPIFLHWFGDTWIREIAIANGVFTHLKDFTLVHDKPSDRGMPDETHSRIRQWGWHERDRYVNESCGHFLHHEKKRLGIIMSELKHRKHA